MGNSLHLVPPQGRFSVRTTLGRGRRRRFARAFVEISPSRAYQNKHYLHLSSNRGACAREEGPQSLPASICVNDTVVIDPIARSYAESGRRQCATLRTA
ncbi:hypothetical protein EVAR_86177_1 [Eumeta japonica]|uniref:Uncharacterized protein n=1 Tax=Eumeta variegata TaxID=151549 RepID=A0A4C1UCW9_EUMVA|nr:hypothetical protein EVAR_86177_1 [Eumeta japonica]